MHLLFLSILAGILLEINLMYSLIIVFVLIIILILNKKCIMIFLYFFVIFSLFLYTRNEINKYDTRYVAGAFRGNVTILSEYGESESYLKYLCKNESGDKFVLFINKVNSRILNNNDKLFLDGRIIIPDIARNTGGSSLRRYYNSNGIYGYIIATDYFLLNINRINIIEKIRIHFKNVYDRILPSKFSQVMGAITYRKS